MKKIGIITILKVGNYGAELQAYATQHVLRKLGYDAEIIDYLFYKHPLSKRSKHSKPSFHFPLKKRLVEYIYPILGKIKSIGHKEALIRRSSRFDRFHRENTVMSPTYRSIDELYAAEMDYDTYITGSDQVWNPGIYSSLKPYFLDFAPSGCKRIAYASSFGVSEIPNYACSFYKTMLEKYDSIGVRENNAVGMVWDIAGKQAQCVLDPTLLLNKDEWLEVAKPMEITEPYILIYELTPCNYIRQLAEHIAALGNLRIVRICKEARKTDKDNKILNIVDAGPAEFLALFSKASIVVTNSFHGTAFSINFQRPFYTVTPLRKQNNSRQQSLLNLLGVGDRLLPEGTELPKDDIFSIDYGNVCAILANERAKSVDFLIQAIDGK